jgi:hypothetical protein
MHELTCSRKQLHHYVKVTHTMQLFDARGSFAMSRASLFFPGRVLLLLLLMSAGPFARLHADVSDLTAPQETDNQPPKPAVPAELERSHSSGDKRNLSIDLTYSERVRVPRGSKINLKINDASGKQLVLLKTSTRRDGPPYHLDIHLPPIESYPITINADLESRVGHRFMMDMELSKETIENGAPIVIHLNMR